MLRLNNESNVRQGILINNSIYTRGQLFFYGGLYRERPAFLRKLKYALSKIYYPADGKPVGSKIIAASQRIEYGKQKAQREVIKEAAAYAGKINRDPELRKAYEEKLKPGENVFYYARKEFFEKRKKEQGE